MRGLGYRLTDVLVVAACTLAFVAIASPSRHEPKGPPIALIAQDLGTTPDAFRHAADRVGAHRQPGHPPSDEQKQAFATALDVSVEQLEAVMEKYRPDRLRQP
jgi:hypothetical protein